jgi:two-component system, LytTR family, response regulator
MIKVLIAEDELLARERLVALLHNEKDIEIVAACRNGTEAVAQIQNKNPDVLFLDVEMPGIDGFGVLNAIDLQTPPIIVFTTAYDQYAVRAFDIQAQDYLLKPFDQDRFSQALNRVRLQFRARQRSEAAKEGSPRKGERILVKSRGRILFLRVKEIDWIEAAGNYVQIHVGEQTHILREKIGTIEEALDTETFVRIHRSLIVNSDRIKELQPCGNSEYLMVLKNGKSMSVSRSYRARLDQFVKKLIAVPRQN